MQNSWLILLLAINITGFSQDKPMYKIEPVNSEIANSIKDYELTSRVFVNINLSFDTSNQDLKEQLYKKTIQEQTLYYAIILDMQVLNGGIYQYFGNYGNIYDMNVISALQNLGLMKLASEFKQISKLSNKEYSEVKSDFDAFNVFYYKINQKNSMDSQLKKFILQNINVFEKN